MNKTFTKILYSNILILLTTFSGYAIPLININQEAFDSKAPKIAVLQTDLPLSGTSCFNIVSVQLSTTKFKQRANTPQELEAGSKVKLFGNCNGSKLN